MNIIIAFMLTVTMGASAWAQTSTLEILDIPTNEDTVVTIKKGPIVQESKRNYEILSGSDEISSDEEYDDKKALAGWKQACADWKKELKQLNQDNRILSMSCGDKTKNVDQSKFTYKSHAQYKIRVKVKD